METDASRVLEYFLLKLFKLMRDTDVHPFCLQTTMLRHGIVASRFAEVRQWTDLGGSDEAAAYLKEVDSQPGPATELSRNQNETVEVNKQPKCLPTRSSENDVSWICHVVFKVCANL